MTDWEIRPLQPREKADLVRLWQYCGLTRPWNKPDLDIERKLVRAPELLLVAVRGDQLIGSVMVGYEGHRGWVNYLAVLPSCRRQGLGRALMQAAELAMQQCGCPKINLQIRAENPAAVAFYAALGYTEDHVTSMGKRLIDDE